MMPLTRIEKIVCGLLILAIVGNLGKAVVNFCQPRTVEQQRVEMESRMEICRAFGLAGGGR